MTIRLATTALALLTATVGQAQITIQTDAQSMVKAVSQNNYYRVVVKGFSCNRETADDILERDGKRDEVYLGGISYMLNNQGQTIPRTLVRRRSRTMGDVNGRAPEERRCMAGTAAGNLGGIRTGDQLPDADPWRNKQPAKSDLLPFILWEGELPPGGDQVVIYPSLFEYDGPDDIFTQIWHNSSIVKLAEVATFIPGQLFASVTGIGGSGGYNDDEPGVHPAPSVAQNYPNQFMQLNLQGIDFAKPEYRSFVVDPGRPGDRPIGITYGANNRVYNPLQIRLDNNAIRLLSQQDFGYGRGIVPIRFKDQDEWKGDYTLYFSFEQVNDMAQRNQINVTNRDILDPLKNYRFRNVFADSKVADVLNGGRENGTFVVLNDDKVLDSERWRIRKANEYYYFISNNYNNMYLGLWNNNNINGCNIALYNHNPGDQHQQWGFIRYCDGSYIVYNVATKRAMEVYNAASAVGSPLGQWDNTAAANQRWMIE
jgi:hypothetical protein